MSGIPIRFGLGRSGKIFGVFSFQIDLVTHLAAGVTDEAEMRRSD